MTTWNVSNCSCVRQSQSPSPCLVLARGHVNDWRLLDIKFCCFPHQSPRMTSHIFTWSVLISFHDSEWLTIKQHWNPCLVDEATVMQSPTPRSTALLNRWLLNDGLMEMRWKRSHDGNTLNQRRFPCVFGLHSLSQDTSVFVSQEVQPLHSDLP